MTALASVLWMAFYFVIFTPLSFAWRLARNDPLMLERSPALNSYWRPRHGQSFQSMTSRY